MGRIIREADVKVQKPQEKKKMTRIEKNIKKLDEKVFNAQLHNLLDSYVKKVIELPARQDLKTMLFKSLYGLYTMKKVDSEISFLYEVKIYLNKVRQDDAYYSDLLSMIEDIYMLAADRDVQKQNKQQYQIFKGNYQEEQKKVEELFEYINETYNLEDENTNNLMNFGEQVENQYVIEEQEEERQIEEQKTEEITSEEQISDQRQADRLDLQFQRFQAYRYPNISDRPAVIEEEDIEYSTTSNEMTNEEVSNIDENEQHLQQRIMISPRQQLNTQILIEHECQEYLNQNIPENQDDEVFN